MTLKIQIYQIDLVFKKIVHDGILERKSCNCFQHRNFNVNPSSVGFLFFALVALAIGYVSGKQPHAVYAVLGGWFLLLVGLFLGVRAMMIALKLKKMEPYYRLLIGTSDGRQIPLVDNNRDVLIKIRDVVRHKMDTGDASVTGDFDLNLDIVNLRLPKGAAAPAQPARAQPSDVFDEEEDAPPAGR